MKFVAYKTLKGRMLGSNCIICYIKLENRQTCLSCIVELKKYNYKSKEENKHGNLQLEHIRDGNPLSEVTAVNFGNNAMQLCGGNK
jgi:hypothetical protein